MNKKQHRAGRESSNESIIFERAVAYFAMLRCCCPNLYIHLVYSRQIYYIYYENTTNTHINIFNKRPRSAAARMRAFERILKCNYLKHNFRGFIYFRKKYARAKSDSLRVVFIGKMIIYFIILVSFRRRDADDPNMISIFPSIFIILIGSKMLCGAIEILIMRI